MPDLTVDYMVSELRRLSEDESITADTPVADIDVDSLDLVEWIFAIEDQIQQHIDEEIYADMSEDPGVNVRDIFVRISAGFKPQEDDAGGVMG